MRNLFLFILLLVAIWWFRRSLSGTDRQSPTRPEPPPTTAGGNERMLACAHCGVLVPVSEGVDAADAFFCSQEHARLGPHDKAS